MQSTTQTATTTTATSANVPVLLAAAAVQRAAAPKRDVRLRDEFGPIRGRRVLDAADVEITAGDDVDEFGRRLSARSLLAYALC